MTISPVELSSGQQKGAASYDSLIICVSSLSIQMESLSPLVEGRTKSFWSLVCIHQP
jgi:hypothetical protein